ncbi:hypothetical protein TEA_026539 [Camellia sinensis var. sinensis]|uniref:non-specific serine/threonine protein kinase n=1 Tax=Camellia sinensis var. sinensis TaxID=542762 RepID=A0A4S4D086_CAMSN|nr:hypothetical protein TEA_026539 [Camellia sinensis var. sinensis]
MMCLKNCSCTAYANLDITGGGSGCLLWLEELIDMKENSENGQDIYIRMAFSELVGTSFLIVFTSISTPLCRNLMNNLEQGCTDKSQKEDLELPLFDLAVIGASTKSDKILTDQTRSTLLDWPKRFHIINGVSRGLLYLHQDSRLRIIHRDLKASNILLDIDMNPKISDFGMAGSFQGNETEANTSKVVGTYGYISSEYAVDGLFSVKSNVFIFGVLVLEIMSGKKNRGFYHPNHHLNLLGHHLFRHGNSTKKVSHSCYLTEVLRSIHADLLCVQQSLEDRPSMSSVVLMFGGERTLPQAKQLGFFTERNVLEAAGSSSKETTGSVNKITITLLNAR